MFKVNNKDTRTTAMAFLHDGGKDMQNFFSESPFWNNNNFKDISQNFGLFPLKTVFSQNIFLHETIRISAAIKNFNFGKALAQKRLLLENPYQTFICSNSTVKTLEKGVKYV